jgi:hypothetical protein
MLPCLLLLACTRTASEPTAPTSELDDLVLFAEVWAFAKAHHPRIASREVDWDATFVDALPRMRDSAGPPLEALHDLLDVAGEPAPSGSSASGRPPSTGSPTATCARATAPSCSASTSQPRSTTTLPTPTSSEGC